MGRKRRHTTEGEAGAAQVETVTPPEATPATEDEAFTGAASSAGVEAPPRSEATAPEPDDVAPEADADVTPPDAHPAMADGITTLQVVEALLFASDAPMTPQKIVAILGVGSAREVRDHIDALNARYEQAGAAFRVEKLAGGYQMLTLPVYNTWLRRLKQSRQDSKLSGAALETLAVVAYKQPVVRAQIEALRGVSAGEMLNRLRELGLIKIVGRAEDVGRPMLYGTTRKFLEVFGLASLDELPEVEELQAPRG